MDKMSSLELALRESHLELDPKTGYVRWASTNPKHPRNWSMARKVWDIGLITLLELYTCVKLSPAIKFALDWLTVSFIELQSVPPGYVHPFPNYSVRTDLFKLVCSCQICPRKTRHQHYFISVPFCFDVRFPDIHVDYRC